MRNILRLSVLLPLLTILGIPVRAETDEKLFEWCMSHFPEDEGESAKPPPRPVGKLRLFDLTNVIAPPDLITKTQIESKRPPEIEKYRGHWTWPSVEEPPMVAVFVERLTPTELAIAWVFKSEKSRDESDYRELRSLLKWTGKTFHSSQTTPEGTEKLDIQISADGRAMLIWSGYSRLVTLEDTTGKQSSHTFGEGWPFCLISEGPAE